MAGGIRKWRKRKLENGVSGGVAKNGISGAAKAGSANGG